MGIEVFIFSSFYWENGGVRVFFFVDVRKLYGGKCIVWGCWEIGRFGCEYFGLVKFEKVIYFSDLLFYFIILYLIKR